MFKEANERQTKLEDTINILGQSITKDIYQAVKKATQILSQRKKKYENAYSISEEELKIIIDSKADKIDMNDIKQFKASKEETI